MGILEAFRSLLRKLIPKSSVTASGLEDHPTRLVVPQDEQSTRIEVTRALIIDDSKTVVVNLRKILVSIDYTTLEAFDAETGIEIARAESPDVIFLDIILPGMNGFAALRQLRSDPITKGIPIIMMSSNEQATEQFFGGRIGADDFMKKPFAREEVFARLNRLFGKEFK